MNNIWQLQEAKRKFSQVVEEAQKDGVQIVTKNGRNTVVILSYQDYERLTSNSKKLSEFLQTSPLSGSELDVERSKEMIRDSHLDD